MLCPRGVSHGDSILLPFIGDISDHRGKVCHTSLLHHYWFSLSPLQLMSIGRQFKIVQIFCPSSKLSLKFSIHWWMMLAWFKLYQVMIFQLQHFLNICQLVLVILLLHEISISLMYIFYMYMCKYVCVCVYIYIHAIYIVVTIIPLNTIFRMSPKSDILSAHFPTVDIPSGALLPLLHSRLMVIRPLHSIAAITFTSYHLRNSMAFLLCWIPFPESCAFLFFSLLLCFEETFFSNLLRKGRQQVNFLQNICLKYIYFFSHFIDNLDIEF